MQNMSGGKTALGFDLNMGAMLCHMPLCCIQIIYSTIVALTDKENKFVRFCAFQCLLLWAFWLVFFIVFGTIFSIITFGFGLFIMAPLGFAPLVLDIILAVKAYKMEKLKLPVIGDLAEQWS